MTISTEQKRSAVDVASTPQVSPWLWSWFTWYAEGYLRKRFHALRLLKETEPHVKDGWPLIVYLNHPSWYDPLVGLYLARRYFSERSHFAPMDAAALAKYRLLEKLGFYGIERGSRRGAVNFIRRSESILSNSAATIWMTPQGQFTDVRARPTMFQPGLAHLVERLPRVALLPLALEYAFWNESQPEILAAFGDVIYCEASVAPPALEAELERVQDRLADAAQAREPARFQTLIAGRAGVGGVYDLWRRSKAMLRGERFEPQHEVTR